MSRDCLHAGDGSATGAPRQVTATVAPSGGKVLLDVNLRDASGNTLTGQLLNGRRALDVALGFGDSPAIDSFGNLRVVQSFPVFVSKQIFDAQPLFWDDQQTSGGGTTTTHSVALAASTLAVSASTAGARVRQTKRRMNYRPANGQKILITRLFGAPAAGITRRSGYFDDANGAFFEQNSTGLRVVLRSSTSGAPVDTVVAQTAFSKDTLDGAGPSGVLFSHTNAQLLFIDFGWLGQARVRFGIFYRGLPLVCHEFYFSNESVVPWCSTPNLPLRDEITNSGAGGAASLVQFCSSVVSEGGQQVVGFSRAVSRGASVFTTAAGNNDIYPLISMRLKGGVHLAASISQLKLSIISSTNADFRWGLYLNPTIAGVDAASWVSDSNTSVEYDITRNNTNKVSGGILLDSGYGAALVNQLESNVAEQVKLGSTIAGVADQLVLTVQRVDGTTAENFFASMTFLEDL